MDIKLKVYVAGPYTSNPEVNTQRAIGVGNQLLDAGLMPLIPHLSHWMHLHTERDYEQWMLYGNQLLQCSDCVYRIEGVSPGADRETKQADEWDLPVFYGGYDWPKMLAWKEEMEEASIDLNQPVDAAFPEHSADGEVPT